MKSSARALGTDISPLPTLGKFPGETASLRRFWAFFLLERNFRRSKISTTTILCRGRKEGTEGQMEGRTEGRKEEEKSRKKAGRTLIPY